MANSDKKTADEEVTKGGTDVGGDGTGGSVNTGDTISAADGPTENTSKPKDDGFKLDDKDSVLDGDKKLG